MESQALFSFSGKGVFMSRETGSGKTPENLVLILNDELKEKSLNSISKATGVGIAALHRYQKGIGDPTTSTLERLSDYFKVSVAWLRGESHMRQEDEQEGYDLLPGFEKDYKERNKSLSSLISTAKLLDLTSLVLLNDMADELLRDLFPEPEYDGPYDM
jgi:transcriptional regulator with XRE-family HTH domain